MGSMVNLTAEDGHRLSAYRAAPAGTPKAIVTRLNTEFNKALQQPDLRKRLGDEGADPLGGTPEQFADLIRDGFGEDRG